MKRGSIFFLIIFIILGQINIMETFVTPTDCPIVGPQSLCNRSFCDVFVLWRWFSDFSVGVGAFVIRLSQISSLF